MPLAALVGRAAHRDKRSTDHFVATFGQSLVAASGQILVAAHTRQNSHPAINRLIIPAVKTQEAAWYRPSTEAR